MALKRVLTDSHIRIEPNFGTWLYDSVTKRIFCSGWCAEEFRNAHGVSDG